MNLPAEYKALKTLHQQFIAMSEDTRASINQIDQLLKQATALINTLAREHPAEEMTKARTSALTLLEKAQKQAESYAFVPEQAPLEAESNPFIDVIQPAQEALDLFLHTAFPEQQQP